MGEVKISNNLVKKLNKLSKILFEKGYFGFKEDSENYVKNIFDFIQKIPYLKHQKSKNPLYGEYFVKLTVKNKRTVYYITFSKKDNRHLIKNIFSSHEKEYPDFIK